EGGEAPAESLSREAAVEATVRNALALTDPDRAAWRREIVEALAWVEAGRGVDFHLAHDLVALRRIVPPGRCLRCDAPCLADGGHWCVECSVKEVKAMEVRP
ncbi:MAG: hypothetical protein M3R02_15505, partial [Chloroflexota bacterium]|nr:hypothetical protein [Chloroflexota bacterium]